MDTYQHTGGKGAVRLFSRLFFITFAEKEGKDFSISRKKSEVILADIDINEALTMRENIPCWQQKRGDVYATVK